MEKSALPKASKDTRVTVTDPVMQRGATGSQVRICSRNIQDGSNSLYSTKLSVLAVHIV